MARPLPPRIDEDPRMFNRLSALVLLTAVVTGCAHRLPAGTGTQSPTATAPGRPSPGPRDPASAWAASRAAK